MKLSVIYSAALMLIFPAHALAAPAITGTSGTLSQGNSCTVSGSGFGTKSTQNGAAPVAYSDMENNSVNARLGGPWASTGDLAGVPGFMTVSTSYQRHSHSTYNGVCDFTDWGTCGFEGGAVSAQWYAQYWFYLPTAFSWGSGDQNNKIFRMYPSGGGGGNNLRVVAPAQTVDVVVEIVDEGHGGYGTGWDPVVPGGSCIDALYGHSGCDPFWAGGTSWREFEGDMTENTWHLFQFEFQSGDLNTANGILRWWVDGKLVFSHDDITTRTSAYPSHMYPGIIGMFASSGAGDATGPYHIDDAYVDNSWQRVEIGNNATYNSCTLREIQPATSWADGSVTFTVNQGSFADSSAGYIFVTDASGVRNTGYSVTFGAGESDTTAPTVTAFTVPTTATSLTVPVSSFTATDAVGVTGYCINESATAPTSGSCSGSGWAGSAQSTVTASTSGSITFYAWAKDAAGNISSSATDGVVITLPAASLSGGMISGGIVSR